MEFKGKSCCSICLHKLGRLWNRGTPCSFCANKICKNCRIVTDTPSHKYICKVCKMKWIIDMRTREYGLFFGPLPLIPSTHAGTITSSNKTKYVGHTHGSVLFKKCLLKFLIEESDAESHRSKHPQKCSRASCSKTTTRSCLQEGIGYIHRQEIIQNADDASVKKVHYFVDHWHHAQTNMVIPSLGHFQRPSLVSANGAVFSEEDLVGIQNLQHSIEADGPFKVGRFGIGFNYVYHLTDVPSTVNSDIMVYLDPQAKLWDGQSGRLFKLSEIQCKDNVSSFHGIADFNSRNISYCPKNLLRFPLRTTSSNLSENVYKLEKLLRLTNALKKAKLLLIFLHSVTSIEVYEINSNGVKTSLFQTKVTGNTLPDLAQKRSSLMHKVKDSHRQHQYNFSAVHTFIARFDVSTYERSTRTTTYWLVENQVSSSIPKVREDYVKQNIFTWVGTALELDSCRDSWIFCFLPMPIEASSKFSMHINCTFSLNDDQWSPKWPGGERRNGPMANGNRLVNELVPSCNVSLLLEAKKVMCGDNLKSTNCEGLLQPLFVKLLKSDVVWSEAIRQPGEWVIPTDAVYIPQSINRLKADVGKTLTRCGVKIAKFQDCIRNTFSFARVEVNQVIRDSLRANIASYRNAEFNGKLEFLTYCFSDSNFVCLDQLELPLDNGSFLSFHRLHSGACQVYLTSDCPRSLFPNLDHKLVDFSSNANLNKCLSHVTYSNQSQLRVLSSNQYASLIDEAMSVQWRNLKIANFPCNERFPKEWFKIFLEWVSNKSLVLFSNKLIVPVQKTSLSSANQFPVIRLASSKAVLYIPHYQMLAHEMTSLLIKYGVMSSPQNLFLYLSHPGLESYILSYSSYDIIEITCKHWHISPSLAKYLKVTPLSEELDVSEDTFTDSCQYEPIILRLKNILKDYKDGVTIVKELIQNVDDAEATEINICFDSHSHKLEQRSLFFPPCMHESHGPALLVHNNSTFSNEDFDNIQKIIAAKKQEKHLKIGKFGIGFCSVYHFTDVPSPTSRFRINIFYPTLKHLRKEVKNSSQPGKMLKYLSKDIQKSSQLSLYEGLFDFSSSTDFQGTMFCLPFLSAPRELSSTYYTTAHVKELFDGIREGSDKLLLFLQHGNGCLMSENWQKFQGPDLLVWNDSTFSEDDLKGIQELGFGSKHSEGETFGQHGIGFNAVYHLTNCPSFINGGKTLCILNPHCMYADRATKLSPGRRYDKLNEEFWKNFSDMSSSLDNTSRELRGESLFRFPIRHSLELVKSVKIFYQDDYKSSQTLTAVALSANLKEWMPKMKRAMLLLNNVTEIRYMEIEPKSTTLKTVYHFQSRIPEPSNFELQLHNSISSFNEVINCQTCSRILTINKIKSLTLLLKNSKIDILICYFASNLTLSDSLNSLQSLPFFEDVTGNYQAIEGKPVYVWPMSCLAGCQTWLAEQNSVFIKPHASWTHLGSAVQLSVQNMSAVELHNEFIFPHFGKMSEKERYELLEYIRDVLFSRMHLTESISEREGNEKYAAKILYESLLTLKCIGSDNSVLLPICSFCDHIQELFHVVFKYFQILSKTLESPEWLSSFKELNLKQNLTETEYLQFCKKTADGSVDSIRNCSTVLLKYLFSMKMQQMWCENTRFLSKISSIPFVFTEKAAAVDWVLPGAAQANQLVKLNGSASIHLQHLVWTVRPIIQPPVIAEKVNKKLPKNLGVVVQPSISDVASNIRNISKSCYAEHQLVTNFPKDYLPPDVVSNLMVVLEKNFKFLSEYSDDSLFFKLSSLTCIPIYVDVCKKDKKQVVLVHPNCVLTSTKECCQFHPLSLELPTEFFPLSCALKEIGVQFKIGMQTVLGKVFKSSEGLSLDPNTKESVNLAITKLKVLLTHEEKPDDVVKCLTSLYLPSNHDKLKLSTSLLYKDTASYFRHIEVDLTDTPYSYFDMEKDNGSHAQHFCRLLPLQVRPKGMSQKCKQLPDEECQLVESSKMALRLESSFQDQYNLVKIINMFVENLYQDHLFKLHIEKLLSHLIITIYNLKAQIILTGNNSTIGHVKSEYIFLSDESESCLYLDSEADHNIGFQLAELIWIIVSQYMDVNLSTDSVSDLTTIIGEYLTSAASPQKLLEKFDIVGNITTCCGFDLKVLCVDIPQFYHRRLDQDANNIFKPMEYVGYEVQENKIIVAQVACLVSSEEESSLFFRKYKIYVKMDNEVGREVSILDIHKFLVGHKKYKVCIQDDSRALVPRDDRYEVLNLTAVLQQTTLIEEKSVQLREIWKLIPVLKRRALKRLYLKHHPDKNLYNPDEFALFLQTQIAPLEGEPLDDPDGQFSNISREQAHSSQTHSRRFDNDNWNATARKHHRGENTTEERYTQSAAHGNPFSSFKNDIDRPNTADGRRWARQAEIDLGILQSGLNQATSNHGYAHVCFLAHQVVEKALKRGVYALCDRDGSNHVDHNLSRNALALQMVKPAKAFSLLQHSSPLQSCYLNTHCPDGWEGYTYIPSTIMKMLGMLKFMLKKVLHIVKLIMP